MLIIHNLDMAPNNNKLIITIIKTIDLNNVIHCTDDLYCLITIQGVENMLIYIVSSITLSKHLNKQQDKKKLIKNRVYNIY